MLKVRILAAVMVVLSISVSAMPTVDGHGRLFYAKGVELFRAEQYITAQKELEKALDEVNAESPLVEEIDYYLAVCEARLGDSGAEKHLTAFLEKYPNSIHSTDVRLQLADIYVSQRDFAAAKAQYAHINPSTLSGARLREFYFNKGYAAFTEGDYTEAVKNFNQVGNDRAYGSSAVYYKAYIDYDTDNLNAARQGFASLENDRAYAPLVPFYMMHIDFKSGDYAKVVASADRLLSQADDNRRPEILRIVAESYYHMENYEQALRYMDAYIVGGKTLTRDENYITGFSAYMTGDFQRAVEYLGKVAVGNDLLAQNASFHIAGASLRMGNKLQAQQAFSLAMKLDADKKIKEESMLNFAKLQYELGSGMFDETINTMTAFLAEFPDSPNADEARGYLMTAYLNSNNYRAAYDAISQIRNPNQQERAALQRIAYFRGLEYFNDGDLDNALRMFEVSAQNRYQPKYTALTKFWTAEAYYRKGQYSRAIPLYQDYVVLSPKTDVENIMSHYNLGYCYFNVKNNRESLLWFNRFIGAYTANDGVKADSYNRLGDVYFLDREYTRAMDNYNRAVAIGTSEKYYAEYQKAIVAGLTSGVPAKITALRKIVSDNLGEYVDDAMYELGSTYTKQERFNDAIDVLRDFTTRYPRSEYMPNALLDLGVAYNNQERGAQALEFYKRVVEEYPNTSQAKDALLGIRNIYMENNDLAGYFAYAAKANVETDVSVVERDSLTYTVAEGIYLRGDHKRARPLFEKYLEQFPRGNFIPNATYYAAEGALQEGDTPAALKGFESVSAMAVGPFTVNSLMNAAALNYQNADYEKSAAQYRRLTDLSANRATVAEGLTGYLRSMDKIGDKDHSIEAAEFVLASPFVNADIRAEAKFVLGKAYYDKGDKAKALPELQEVAQNPETRNGAQAIYLVIEMLVESGRDTEAEKEIFRFAERGTSHQYWMAKSFIILGDIYAKKGDAFQAKATYQSIVDGYGVADDGVIEEAKEKINKLNDNNDGE